MSMGCKSIVTALLAFLFLVSAVPATAEQLVAAIVTGNLHRYRQAHTRLDTVIRDAGFDETKLKIFVQTPNADTMSLTNSIRRSVAAGANLVITYGTAATLVAAQEVTDVPVLFVDVYDPVGLGVVQNMEAPGANRSGASCNLSLKPLLENLLKLDPQIKTIGILYSSDEPGSQRQLEDLTVAATDLGLYVVSENARNARKIASAEKSLIEKSDALFLTESVVVSQQAADIIKSALDRKLPVFSQTPGLENKGALFGMIADPDEQGKQVAVHALQVLAGQKAYILPVRKPKQASLVINQQTARYLGLNIPDELLNAATTIVR